MTEQDAPCIHPPPNAIPLYGSEPDEPGLYLGLFHGRKDPDDQMIEWGFNGPLIGPLSFVHTTYTNVIKLGFQSAADEKRYFPTQDMPMLTINGDMVQYQDCLISYLPQTSAEFASDGV